MPHAVVGRTVGGARIAIAPVAVQDGAARHDPVCTVAAHRTAP
ncbi:hypothetical protein ACFQZ4_30385 [Catellatospora coxensis]